MSAQRCSCAIRTGSHSPARVTAASEVRKILHQYDESMTAVRTFTGSSRRRLSIAFLGEAIRQTLVARVEDFRQQHNDVVVECRDCELEEVLALLDAGECDIGF